MEVETKTPEEIMAWLAAHLCTACLGNGYVVHSHDRPGGNPGHQEAPCEPCHGTGRWLWRLVRACTMCSEGGTEYEGVIVPRGTVTSGRVDDDGRIIWEPHKFCGGTRLVTEHPTLDILIDTGLDLGFASIFTPDEWDEVLPTTWITVKTGHKVEDLLRNLEVVVTRRLEHGTQDVISGTPDGFMVNELARTVTVAGTPVNLTPTEYRLFILLWRHRGEVLTKQDILKAVWGPEYEVEFEYIRVYVNRLRNKLGDDAQEPRYILAHPGVGYMMRAT